MEGWEEFVDKFLFCSVEVGGARHCCNPDKVGRQTLGKLKLDISIYWVDATYPERYWMLVGGAAIGKEMATILRITFGSIHASRAELTYFLKDPYFDPSMGLSLREQFGGNKGYDCPPSALFQICIST